MSVVTRYGFDPSQTIKKNLDADYWDFLWKENINSARGKVETAKENIIFFINLYIKVGQGPQKHLVFVNHLGGLCLPRNKVVPGRLTDHTDMTIAVYHGSTATRTIT